MTTLTLTKKTMSLLIRDDARALAALIPAGVSALNVELQGEKIAVKCAEAGAMRCLEALLDREPAQAGAILGERDGTLARVADLAAFYAEARLVKKMIQLAGPAIVKDEDAQTDPGLTLTRALKGAQWEAARVWLDASPELALTITPYGRSMLHLTAERSFEHESAHPDAAWTPPPKALVERLLELGAKPAWLSPKGHGPLSRAIARQTRSTIGALLDWQKSAPEPFPLSRLDAGSNANFSPLHEAVWANDAETLLRLIDLGADIEEPTAGGSTPLRLAVRRDAFACAAALVDRGAKMEADKDPAGPLSLAALHGAQPLVWIEWLTQRGSGLFGRDGMGSSFTEVAMEKLSLDEARMVWRMSPAEHRLRAPLSLLGVFERAARSDHSPTEKMAFLLSEGLLPARVNAGEDWKSEHGRRFAFGEGGRSAHLGPLWLTSESDPHLPTSVPCDDDDEDDDFSITPANNGLQAKAKRERQAGARPSLLGYLAARGARDSLLFLLEWDQKNAYFRDPDYILAWREGLRSDAPMSVMKPLAAALGARSLPLWGEDETKLATAHFGPKKGKDLGFSPLTASAFIQEQIEQGPKNIHAVFERKGKQLAYSDTERAPWARAGSSHHAGAMRVCLADDGKWAASCAARAAESLANDPQRASTLAWVVDSLPSRAAKADPRSPWGQRPEAALSLWDQQIEWEYRFAIDSAVALSPQSAKALAPLPAERGGVAGRLLRQMIQSDNTPAAARLIRLGLPAPDSLDDTLHTLGHQVARHTGLGASPEKLSHLRDFCEALASREDLRALLAQAPAPEGDGSNSPLSRLPDPVIFETLMAAGAPVGSGPANVFSALARFYASRLSPAFAQRLADWAQRLDPEGGSLDVAAALASMRKHHSILELSDSSTAATERVLRAASEAKPEDWEAAHRRDSCPIEAALSGGNISIATRLAALAPDSYREEHRAQWAARWLSGRARNLSEALQALPASHWDLPSTGALSARPSAEALSGSVAESSEDPDGSPQAELATRKRRNLERVVSEISDLAALGSALGMDPVADTRAAQVLCEEHSGRSAATSLLWALCQGLRPAMLIPTHELPYSASHALRNREGRLVPAVAAALDSRDHPMSARLYVEWTLRGLPTAIQIRQPLGDLLDDAPLARVEPEEGEPRELIELLAPAARALAEEMLLERELLASASPSAPEQAPSSRPRKGL